MRSDRLIGIVLVLTLIVLVGVGLWRTSAGRGDARIALAHRCQAVMGTACTMVGVVPHRRRVAAPHVFREAEAKIRAIEGRMSSWLNDSEVGRLNAAAADLAIPLSPETRGLLRIARQAGVQTDGAFDVTCRPLIESWRRAAKVGALPGQSELGEARAASNWELVELTETGAVKRRATARLDLGGIAKGYAVDRALEVLRSRGFDGGLVDLGGDLACFGTQPSGKPWSIDVQNPFGPGQLATLRLSGGAVCTSGNYARYVNIAGKRYSHIIDPRTGRPADAAPSVTVLASTATVADVWATALSILGTDGFRRLPDGVEAMMVLGTEDDYRLVCTVGFRGRLEDPPARLQVLDPRSG